MNSIAVKTLVSFTFLLKIADISGQNLQQIENAITFTKLYGYVKYFHPSDEAASIDWNRMAIYGSRQVSECKNTDELQKVLMQLFKPIAPTLQLFPEGNKTVFNKDALMVKNAADYKTIAWQHSGVGFGGKESVYKSARTNRAIINNPSSELFAPALSSINAEPLQGKPFVFRCRLRLVNGDGKGQLWARVDRANKMTGFFDNMDDRPVKKKEWAEYEIKGKVDADGIRLVFGVMLIGTGEIEFDDLSLQVQEGNTWKELYAASFSQDEKNKAPKELSFSPALLANYTIAVQKDDAGVQSFVSIKSKETGKEEKANTTIFKQYPQVGEYLQKSIGSGLRVMLPLALYGTATNSFPSGDSTTLRLLKESLVNIPNTETTGDNLFTRLGNLAITWNIFQHFYPYFEVTKTNWNSALKEAIQQAYIDKNAQEFQTTLKRMTAKLKDGHVRVNLAGSKLGYMPLLLWEWIENELVVTFVGDTSIPLKRGDIVKQIDNHSAKDYFATIYPNISAATKGWLEHRAQAESLLGEKGSIMKLSIMRNNNALSEVAVVRNANQMQYYSMLPVPDTIKALPNGMTYINIGAASMEAINKEMPQLQQSRVIICDLRGYPNSNHGFIAHLLTINDTSSQWMQIPQIIYPDQEKIAGWQKESWHLQTAKPHLDARIIFLIDGRAISYAESFMSFIENYKLATIIGQPTAGTNGNINPFNLPGGYYITWTGMKVQKHNGTTHHGVGILPNIYVQKTISGVREGKDEFLEKALEVGNKGL